MLYLPVHIRKFKSGYAPQIDHAHDPLRHQNRDHGVHLAKHFREKVYIHVR